MEVAKSKSRNLVTQRGIRLPDALWTWCQQEAKRRTEATDERWSANGVIVDLIKKARLQAGDRELAAQAIAADIYDTPPQRLGVGYVNVPCYACDGIIKYNCNICQGRGYITATPSETAADAE